MNYQSIRYEVEEKILTITLNRPDHLNAFTVEMSDELVHAFTHASDDDDVGAIVVTGAGRAFCAGMDLSTDGNVFGLNEELVTWYFDFGSKYISCVWSIATDYLIHVV